MKLSEILNEQRTRLDVDAGSKKRVLETLGELLAAGVPTPDDDTTPAPTAHAIFDALCAREKLGSTGLGHGVGLPHARMSGLQSPLGALLRLTDKVDYDAPDKAGVDLVFALLVPEESTEDHLQLLAQLAARLGDAGVREALRSCETPRQAIDLLTGDQAGD